MSRYLLRRLLFGVFTLLLLSMITFGLVKCAPADKILQQEESGPLQLVSYRQQLAESARKARSLHLHQPVFYFAITTADRPDTLERIFPYDRRERLLQLLGQSGNWPAVQNYDQALLDAQELAVKDASGEVGRLRIALFDVSQARALRAIDSLAGVARDQGEQMQISSALQLRLADLVRATHTLRNDLQTSKQWIPALHWYGRHNQYHRWASAFLRGDLGQSTFHHPVWEIMRFPLLNTLFINGIAFFLAFCIAIPLGVAMARRGGRFDRLNRWGLLLLHAMPGFWLGGMLLLLFGTPGAGLHVINGINLSPYDPADGPFLLWAAQHAEKFILPVATLTLHTLALIALQLRGSIREVISQDFIRTARAKGITEAKVYRYHAFRNSLAPMIVLLASLFPALFAGSIMIEYLFNFPGMGLKTIDAYDNQDYPLLFAILMLGAVLTVAGNFVGDVLYAWADPRVRFDKTG